MTKSEKGVALLEIDINRDKADSSIPKFVGEVFMETYKTVQLIQSSMKMVDLGSKR